MPKKNYPYQNLSLKDLKGEDWHDIPGLDGYFLISNFGRIKRQRYETQYRNGAIYIKPEKIIKPQIVKQLNKFKSDLTFFLVARATIEGHSHNITIARMVYHCFVEAFDLADQNIVIICKDANNFNIRLSNLTRATKSQKQQRMIARKRFKSPLLKMTEQERENQRQAIIKKISKQVTQYSMNGKKIKTYPSAAEAERATGIFATSIRNAASGGGISAGSFTWRWGKESSVDIKTVKQEKRIAYVKKYGQRLTQYDLSGRRMAHYPSVKDAAEASGAHETAIYNVLKGKYKSAKRFFWTKGYSKKSIDLSKHKWGRESMAITQSKAVKKYSRDGKYLQTFPSIKLAARSIRLQPSSVIGALKGRQLTSGGFKWKYAKPD